VEVFRTEVSSPAWKFASTPNRELFPRSLAYSSPLLTLPLGLLINLADQFMMWKSWRQQWLIDQTTRNSGIILLLTIHGSLVWLSIHAVGNTWLLDKDCLSEFSIDQLSACHLNLLKGIGSQGLVNFFPCIWSTGYQDQEKGANNFFFAIILLVLLWAEFWWIYLCFQFQRE